MPPAPLPPTVAQRVYGALLYLGRPLWWALGRFGVRLGTGGGGRLPELHGRPSQPRPDGDLLWLHAASLGETRSALGLVDSLRAAGLRDAILLTTFTASGAELAGRHGVVVHQYLPWDVRDWVRPFLDHWRPRAAVFVVSEIWPNVVEECRQRGIPMALTGAALSEPSRRRFARVARWGLRPFAALSHVTSPNAAHRERLASLVSVPVRSGPDWKLALPPVAAHPLTAALRAAAGERPVVVFASVHPAEGAALAPAVQALRALEPAPVVVVAPRHPQRIDALARAMGASVDLRRRAGDVPGAGVFWLDTLGELDAALAAADVAFVGASLAPLAGHSPAEAARAGCAIVMGRHGDSNTGVVDALDEAGALVRVDADALATELVGLVEEPPRRAARAAAATAVADRWAQACRDGAEELLRWLGADR